MMNSTNAQASSSYCGELFWVIFFFITHNCAFICKVYYWNLEMTCLHILFVFPPQRMHNKGFKKEFTSYRNTKEELNMSEAEQRLPRHTTSTRKMKLHGLKVCSPS